MIAVVTGASGSMGREAVRSLHEEGHDVIMACRNPEKADKVRREILCGKEDTASEGRIMVMELDLESRASVRNFVREVEKMLGEEEFAGQKIAALFNNAGVLARDRTLCVDGLERVMSVNYLNTAFLTRLLLPLMGEGASVVCMISLTVKYARIDTDWPAYPPSRYSQLGTYAMSKLALLYFAIGLAVRRPDLHVNVADPGVVNSNMITMGRWFDPLADLLFRPFISSPKKGVIPALAALHSKESLCCFVGRGSRPIPAGYISSPLVDALWEQADRLLQL